MRDFTFKSKYNLEKSKLIKAEILVNNQKNILEKMKRLVSLMGPKLVTASKLVTCKLWTVTRV